MASTTDRVMKPTEWEQLGLALRREKAIQTKWQPARGAGCARNSTASGGGRKMSLDIPFYRTDRVEMKPTEWEQLGLALRREKAIQTKWQPARGAGCARNCAFPAEGENLS